MEIAHRLSKSDGKCQQIHGHGMQVELILLVSEGPEGMAMNGVLETMEFGAIKKKFREHIDKKYDHRLVLFVGDEWAGPIYRTAEIKTWMDLKEIESTASSPRDVVEVVNFKLANEQVFLPGLSLVPDDPTVENLAKWIAHWACDTFSCDTICRIDETATNGAEAMYQFAGQLGPRFVEGAR
jgi:6-pyruvoyl-tetrahydropterin synthase